MIDRGALVLALQGTYRGLHRTPLDGMTFTGRKGRSLAERYTRAVIAGDGVLEDLDEAIALRDQARKLGLAVEILNPFQMVSVDKKHFDEAYLEEIALRRGFIDCPRMRQVIDSTPESSYRNYLQRVYNEAELCGDR